MDIDEVICGEDKTRSAFIQIEDNLYRNIVGMEKYGVLDWMRELSQTKRVVISPDAENRVIGEFYARGIAVNPKEVRNRLEKASTYMQAVVIYTVKNEAGFLRSLIFDEGINAEVSAPINNSSGEEKMFSQDDYMSYALERFDEVYLAATRSGIEKIRERLRRFPAVQFVVFPRDKNCL